LYPITATRPRTARQDSQSLALSRVQNGRAGRRSFCGGAARDPDLDLCRPLLSRV